MTPLTACLQHVAASPVRLQVQHDALGPDAGDDLRADLGAA
jgi:hypothetical protein